MLYFHFHSVQCCFLFFWRLPLSTTDYLKVCLVSKCLKIFLLSVCYWFLVSSIVVVEHNLNDFSTLDSLRFIWWPRICVYLGIRSINSLTNAISVSVAMIVWFFSFSLLIWWITLIFNYEPDLYPWDKPNLYFAVLGVVYKCQLDLRLMALLSFSISLLIFYLVVLSIIEKRVILSNYNCGFFDFSFQFSWGLSLSANRMKNAGTPALLWYHPGGSAVVPRYSPSPPPAFLRYNWQIKL